MPWRIPNWNIRVKGDTAGQAGDQGLAYAEPRVAIHDPHEPANGAAAHQAVGVEHDHVVEIAPSPLQPFPKVSGLVPGQLSVRRR